MARYVYGAGTTDFAAVAGTGSPPPLLLGIGATLYLYTAPGGTPIGDALGVTDNLFTAGSALPVGSGSNAGAATITTNAIGGYPFLAPDSEVGSLAVKSTIGGIDYWYWVNPSTLGDIVAVATGNVATLTSSVATQGTNLTTLTGRVTTLEGLTPNTPAWTSITGKPTTFPPSAHTHTTTDVTDLTTVGRALAKAVDAAAARTAIGAGTGNGTSNLTLGAASTQAAPGNHSHVASAIGFTPTGSVTATNAQDAIVQAAALGGGGGGGTADWSTITNIPSTFPPSSHTHPVSQVSDMTAVGRNVATAVDAQTARAAIGAGTGNGTSNLTLGTSSTTAAPGNHTHNASNLVFTPAAGNTATDVQTAIEQAMSGGSISGSSSILVWQYAGGAWPTLPTTKPAGVLKVEAEGPTQPTTLPSWVGVSSGQATLYYEYSPRA